MTMVATPAPTAITVTEYEWLRRGMHASKTAMGRAAARSVAARMRVELAVDISAYRCPFCDPLAGCNWHVGHSPAGMGHFELLARYLRFGVSW